MTLASIVFFVSLLGIAALFSLKYVEMVKQRVYLPSLRARADRGAVQLKALLIRSRIEAAKIPPLMVIILRILVREIALGLAALARLGEKQAHRLADLVSHKRGFERREPRSEFLKQVGDHKNENGFEKA